MASYHVMFGTTNVPAANVTAWSSTEIDVNVPTLSDGIYPVQVTASNDASNLFDFTVGTVITGPVTNISITREGDAVGSNIGLGWTCSTGNVDIYTLTGTFETTQATWTKEFTNVSGTSQIDSSVAGKVGSGTNKWYKIVPTGATLTTGDLTLEVLGKFDYSFASGQSYLISLPVIPFDTSIDSVFGHQLTEGTPGTADKAYGSVGGTWPQAFLNATTHAWAGTLTTIEADQGYYIVINSANPSKAVSVAGKISNTDRSISLSNGSNLVGSAFPVSVPLNSAGMTAANGFTEGTPTTGDKAYESVGGAWPQAFLNNTNHSWTGTFTTLEPGYGFYIILNGSGTTWHYVKPY
jgi:hypothetical protein